MTQGLRPAPWVFYFSNRDGIRGNNSRTLQCALASVRFHLAVFCQKMPMFWMSGAQLAFGS